MARKGPHWRLRDRGHAQVEAEKNQRYIHRIRIFARHYITYNVNSPQISFQNNGREENPQHLLNTHQILHLAF